MVWDRLFFNTEKGDEIFPAFTADWWVLHDDGEDGESEDENAFNNKPLLARILVIAAGPVFNFILAFVFSIVLIHFTGCDPARLTTVVEHSAAEDAGIVLEIQ